jgi:hypothetical protein
MKPNTLFQVRFKTSVTPPIGWKKSAIYNVLNYDRHHNKYLIGKTWLSAKDFIKIEVQDAPVFDKPVLRKIASLKENECIEIPNDTIRDLVLEQAEREGIFTPDKSGMRSKLPTPCFIYYTPINKNKISFNAIAFMYYKILPASKFVEVPQEKEEPITESQKDDCKAADERIKELEKLFKDPYIKVNLSEELSQTKAYIDKLRDICQIASRTGSKEIMQSVFKSIANGEI